MDTRYCPDDEFKAKTEELKAVPTAVDGFMRWVVTETSGHKYMLRPESAKLS